MISTNMEKNESENEVKFDSKSLPILPHKTIMSDTDSLLPSRQFLGYDENEEYKEEEVEDRGMKPGLAESRTRLSRLETKLSQLEDEIITYRTTMLSLSAHSDKLATYQFAIKSITDQIGRLRKDRDNCAAELSSEFILSYSTYFSTHNCDRGKAFFK